MTHQDMLDLLGTRHKILIKERTVSYDDNEVPPFAFINIYAVQEQGAFGYLEVSVKVVGKGNEAEDFVEHPSQFTIALDESQHLPTELLIQQIQMINYGCNTDTVSEKEVEIIRNFNVPSASLEALDPIFITEDFMVEALDDKNYHFEENMIYASHMAFQAVLDDLNEIFNKSKVAV